MPSVLEHIHFNLNVRSTTDEIFPLVSQLTSWFVPSHSYRYQHILSSMTIQGILSFRFLSFSFRFVFQKAKELSLLRFLISGIDWSKISRTQKELFKLLLPDQSNPVNYIFKNFLDYLPLFKSNFIEFSCNIFSEFLRTILWWTSKLWKTSLRRAERCGKLWVKPASSSTSTKH